MTSSPPKVFLDTNVWFSAFYGSKNCEKLIKAHINGEIVGVISQQVLSEIVRNLQKKIPKALPQFQKLILASPPFIVRDPKSVDKKIANLIHKKDQKIFSSIVNIRTKVPYFVTGNIKDFSVKKINKVTGIEVLTPKQAVDILSLK